MDLYRIIDTLIGERNRIDRLIQSLDAQAGKEKVRGAPARRPGRKAMDVRARRDVSERMKRYWSQRRGETAGAAMAEGENIPVAQVQGAGGQNHETS